MNKMKIIISILAAAAAAAVPMTVCAAEINQNTPEPKQASAEISTEISVKYIVTIPEDTAVTFNTVNTDLGAVELTSAQLEPDKCIKVTLNASGELKHEADNTKVLPYAVKKGTADAVTENDYTAETYNAAGEKTDLTVVITSEDWNKAFAGKYSDTLTFGIEYTDAPEHP